MPSRAIPHESFMAGSSRFDGDHQTRLPSRARTDSTAAMLRDWKQILDGPISGPLWLSPHRRPQVGTHMATALPSLSITDHSHRINHSRTLLPKKQMRNPSRSLVILERHVETTHAPQAALFLGWE